jgi:tetratricopeptide (TPR) repeat protein
MFNLDALKSARKSIKDRDDKTDEKFYKAYSEALDLLKVFVKKQHYDKNCLREAADKLADALEVKKNKAEPYFYLAYIFYLIGHTENAVQYLQIAALINPDLNGIETLRKELATHKISEKNTLHHNNTEPEPTENTTPKISKIKPIIRPVRLLKS